MVIGIANKTSSSSTCVLVRRRTRDPWQRQGGDPEPSPPFSCVLGPAVFFLPSSCTRYVLF